MWRGFLAIIVLIILIFLLGEFRKQYTLRQWYKALSLGKHQQNYQMLFTPINGFTLSRNARQNQDAFEYVYGEIEFVSFIALLSLTRPNEQTIFYDLGSGIGTAVIACAMVFPIKKSCGIELFATLHDAALNQVEQLRNIPDYQAVAQHIHFMNQDFLNVNLYEANLIFINATGFFGEIWLKLNQKLDELQQDAVVITTTKKLINAAFRLINETRVQMSWGVVQAFIHKKCNHSKAVNC